MKLRSAHPKFREERANIKDKLLALYHSTCLSFPYHSHVTNTIKRFISVVKTSKSEERTVKIIAQTARNVCWTSTATRTFIHSYNRRGWRSCCERPILFGKLRLLSQKIFYMQFSSSSVATLVIAASNTRHYWHNNRCSCNLWFRKSYSSRTFQRYLKLNISFKDEWFF